MRGPDGHGRVERARSHDPAVIDDPRTASVTAHGYLRAMVEVDDIDDVLARVEKHGTQLVSTEIVQYEDVYRLCYVRGPEGILVGLAQALR